MIELEVRTEAEKMLIGVLKNIWDDWEFILGVRLDLETDEEREMMIEWIAGRENITASDVVRFALCIDRTRDT